MFSHYTYLYINQYKYNHGVPSGKNSYVYRDTTEKDIRGPCVVVLNLGCQNEPRKIDENKLLGPIPKDSNSIAGHGHNKFYKWP